MDQFRDVTKLIGRCHHPHIPRRRKAGNRLRGERAQRGEAFVFGGEGGHSGLLRPFRAGDSFLRRDPGRCPGLSCDAPLGLKSCGVARLGVFNVMEVIEPPGRRISKTGGTPVFRSVSPQLPHRRPCLWLVSVRSMNLRLHVRRRVGAGHRRPGRAGRLPRVVGARLRGRRPRC